MFFLKKHSNIGTWDNLLSVWSGMGGKLGFYNTNGKLLFCPDSSRTCMWWGKCYLRGPVFTKNKDDQEQKTHITFERICVMTGVFGLWSQDVIGRRDALHWRFHSIQHKFVIGKELEIDLEKKRTNNLNPLTHHSVWWGRGPLTHHSVWWGRGPGGEGGRCDYPPE